MLVMERKDIRWIQRFDTYNRALSQLTSAVILSQERKLSDLEEQGLIQAFEYTHELAWKTLKDFLNHRGNAEIFGSKDATRSAFQYGLLEDGEVWMDMIISRNNTSHTYNESIANGIVQAILNKYYSAFQTLEIVLKLQKDKELS